MMKSFGSWEMTQIVKKNRISFFAVIVAIAAVTTVYFWRLDHPTRVEIKELRVGGGAELNAGDEVTVHYILRVRNGSVITDTHKTGQTFSFVVGRGQVLKGWEDGIRGLRVGGVRRMIIPPEFAYGAAGSRDLVAPGATLEVEIELVGIRKAAISK